MLRELGILLQRQQIGPISASAELVEDIYLNAFKKKIMHTDTQILEFTP
jgi:hypothetical protein